MNKERHLTGVTKNKATWLFQRKALLFVAPNRYVQAE